MKIRTEAVRSNNWNRGRSHKTGSTNAEKLSDAKYGATKTQLRANRRWLKYSGKYDAQAER